MGWVQRGNHEYYYRSVMVGGRSRKRYMGRGAAAELAAATDQQRHALRSAEHLVLTGLQQAMGDAGKLIDEMGHWIEILVPASLLLAGYHRHDRSAWRKRQHAP